MHQVLPAVSRNTFVDKHFSIYSMPVTPTSGNPYRQSDPDSQAQTYLTRGPDFLNL